MTLRSSDRVTAAFRNCLQHGDSDELSGLLDPLVLSAREEDYVSWDSFDLTGTGGNPPGEGRPYDLSAVLLAGAEIARGAASSAEDAWVIPDDGTGCHVLKSGRGAPEDDVVAELLRVGALMEDAARSAPAAHIFFRRA